jgi:hypothetical protein
VRDLRILILVMFFVAVFAGPAAIAVLAAQRGIERQQLTLSSSEFYRKLGYRPDQSDTR